MVHNTYYLARHGEATGNVGDLLMGVRDFPLTDRGMAQADVLRVAIIEAKYVGLNFTRAYSSPLSRAFNTGNVALGHAVVREDAEGHKHVDYVSVPRFTPEAPTLTLDHRLLDRNWGDFTGGSLTRVKTATQKQFRMWEYEGNFFNRTDIRVKCGESWRDVYKRASAFLRDIEAQYRGERIFISAHSSSLLMIFYALTRTPLPKCILNEELEIPYATLLKYEPSARGKAKFEVLIPPTGWVPYDFRKK